MPYIHSEEEMMKQPTDITDILNNWEFDPDDQVRIVRAADGRQVLQVRQPLGIEQYELDGRPDGKRISGKESLLHQLEERLARHREAHGSDEGFVIEHKEFLLLQNEGILYYYRYLVLFQINDFERTARDTQHNLQLCELVEKYSASEDDKKEILQYKPYILRMFAVSKAMVCLRQKMPEAAREILESAIEEIGAIPDVDTPSFQFERIRSLNYLRSTLKELFSGKNSSLDKLKNELKRAVEEENYERAAELRDKIKSMHQEPEE
jgi:hypothetical protein